MNLLKVSLLTLKSEEAGGFCFLSCRWKEMCSSCLHHQTSFWNSLYSHFKHFVFYQLFLFCTSESSGFKKNLCWFKKGGWEKLVMVSFALTDLINNSEGNLLTKKFGNCLKNATQYTKRTVDMMLHLFPDHQNRLHLIIQTNINDVSNFSKGF